MNKKINQKYCTLIDQAVFVSHRGISHCCVNKNKDTNISPTDFWNGTTKAIDIETMNAGKNVSGCDYCYLTESKKMPSERTFANSLYSTNKSNLPRIIETDFSNFCNLKCVMCDSDRSSEWAKDEGKPVSTIAKAKIITL